MSLLYFLVQQMMLFSIPLLIVALGGMFCERSGVINIALEGIMVLGGFTGILFINLFQEVLPGQPILLIALLISTATGMVISLVHAYASVNMKANQSISGTAINMFAPAFAVFVARVIRNVQQIPFENQFRIEKVPILGDIPVIGEMFFQNAYITTYLGILILAVSCVVLYKTRFGLQASFLRGTSPGGRFCRYQRIQDEIYGSVDFRCIGWDRRPGICDTNLHKL